MRSAECGIAMGGRSPNEGRAAIPHSAFRTPHWDGMGGEVKIAVVFDTLHPDWEDADYKKEVDAKVEEAGDDVGIAQASVVKDDEDLGVRVKFIHEKFHQAAIVEELIEGRELYVGLIGNHTLQVLPIVELTFGESDGEHRIATYKA